MLLGSKNISDIVSKSPYFAAIITASLVWVGYCWVTRLLLGANFAVHTEIISADDTAL